MPAIEKQLSCISWMYSIIVSLLERARMRMLASLALMSTMPRLLLVSTTDGMLGMFLSTPSWHAMSASTRLS